MSFNVDGKVICLSSVDCFLCVGEFSDKSNTRHGEYAIDPVSQGSVGKPDLCYKRLSLKVRLAQDSNGGTSCYEGLPQ